jgi:hypothetical protein
MLASRSVLLLDGSVLKVTADVGSETRHVSRDCTQLQISIVPSIKCVPGSATKLCFLRTMVKKEQLIAFE